MRLVITGATGMIGSALLDGLKDQNHTLVLLSRNPLRRSRAAFGQWVRWQPGQMGDWQTTLDGADGIINLAGEPIAAKRWSKIQKQKLRSSRIDLTRSLVDTIAKTRVKPKFLISSSAVGYYGPHDDEGLDEATKPGNDFLSCLCREWEEEARKAEAFGIRVALLRTGIVLAKGQGALAKMVPPFKLFAGGPLGSGKQWMPWIHIDDEIGLIRLLIENENATGPINATAPNPVTMAQFAKALGEVLNRPSWFSLPPSVLALTVGEMADMLLTGQRAMPQAALNLGYQFMFPNISAALQSLDL